MDKLQGKKNVGIWIRVSTEDQARGESPEHHEKRARYYAESKGWNIKEVYLRCSLFNIFELICAETNQDIAFDNEERVEVEKWRSSRRGYSNGTISVN